MTRPPSEKVSTVHNIPTKTLIKSIARMGVTMSGRF
jgi:hypothetical protein